MKRDRDNIAFKLKELRRKLKLTQEALAHKLGVSFTSVNRWENGQTQPSPLARCHIEKLFEITTKGTLFQSEAHYENKK